MLSRGTLGRYGGTGNDHARVSRNWRKSSVMRALPSCQERVIGRVGADTS